MLDYMRRNAKSTFIKIFLGLVALSFVIGFGALGYIRTPGGQQGSKAGAVASVGGVDISRQDFFDELERIKRQYAKQGMDADKGLFDTPFFLRGVLANMVDVAVVRLSARDMGTRVSDNEVAAYLRRSGSFRIGGKFSRDRLLNYLRRTGQSIEEFEDNIRFVLGGAKLITLLQSSVFVTEDELWRDFQASREKVSLEVIKLTRTQAAFDESSLTEEDLKTAYDASPEDYREAEKRRLNYFSLSIKDAMEDLEVSDEEVLAFYEDNPDRYEAGEQVRYLQILLEGPADATDADRKALKERGGEIRVEAVKPEADFAALARKHSDDPSAEKGGDSGWQGRTKGVKAVKDRAFEMSPGEISELIETPDGLAIIKLIDQRESGTQPFEEVRGRVRVDLELARAREDVENRITQVFQEMTPESDLIDFAEKKGFETGSTPGFTQAEGPKGVEKGRWISAAIFDMADKEIAGPHEGFSRWYVYQLAEVFPSHIPPFDEIKDAVRKKEVANKKDEIIEEMARGLLDFLRKGEKTMAQVATEVGAPVIETGEFAASSFSVPKVGFVKGLVEEAFGVLPPEEYPAEPLEYAAGVALFRVAGRVKADRSDFETEYQRLEAGFLSNKRLNFINTWIDGRRSRYPTVENQEFWGWIAQRNSK